MEMIDNVRVRLNGNLWKFLAAFAGVLITTGAFCATIKYTVERVEKVEAISMENQICVRELKKDIAYIREGVDDLKRMKRESK